MKLKDKVTAALSADEAKMLTAALMDLGNQVLDANTRWRVLQVEHVLLEHSVERMDEP